MALIYISLVANDVEHLFMCCFWSIYVSSLEKCLFRFCAYVLVVLFVRFFVWFFDIELHEGGVCIFGYSSLVSCLICKYFLQSEGCIFVLFF